MIEPIEINPTKHSKILARQWNSDRSTVIIDVIDGDDRAEIYLDASEAKQLMDWLNCHMSEN